jgi:Transglutaminase-like superfamily
VSIFTTGRRFMHLSGSDRTTVLETVLGVSATRVGLRIFGFRRWKNLIDRIASPPGNAADQARLAEAAQVARIFGAAVRHLFFRSNCLEQAMTLCYILRRRGMRAEVHFGARKQSAGIEAHAWVAYLNVPLNEDQGEHRHFLPFEGANPLMETLPD